jgi:hypothetical protein
MEAACLDYCLTEKERLEFDQNGFLVVEDALPPEIVEEISPVVDRLDAQYRAREGSDPDVFQGKPTGTIDPNRPPDGLLGPHDRLNLLDFVGKTRFFWNCSIGPRRFQKCGVSWGGTSKSITPIWRLPLRCSPVRKQ